MIKEEITHEDHTMTRLEAIRHLRKARFLSTVFKGLEPLATNNPKSPFHPHYFVINLAISDSEIRAFIHSTHAPKREYGLYLSAKQILHFIKKHYPHNEKYVVLGQ